MKKYFTTLIIGLVFFFLGIITLLFEIVNFDNNREYNKYNATKEYRYSLKEKYYVYNNKDIDNIEIVYDNLLENEMVINVSYNNDIVSLESNLSTYKNKNILNIYGKPKYVNFVNKINIFYNIIKSSIQDKAIYEYSDLYDVKLEIHINESEVTKITNYTSIIENED